MRDYLIAYNECDVVPFLEGCVAFRDELRVISTTHAEQYIEAYQDTMGMPTFASRVMVFMSQKPFRKKFNQWWNIPRVCGTRQEER